MIYDLRSYATAPGRLPEYLDLHEKHAFPLLRKHLGEPLGYWTTVSGEINKFVHMWRFENLGDMEKRHADLLADKAYHDYRAEVLGKMEMLQRQESVLLRPLDLDAMRKRAI
jgi:hypothetical protein